MNNIGQRIKELRHKRDLTQEKLADWLCVSYQAVSKWECGVANPDITMIGPLTKVLGVTADELLGLAGTGDADRRAELEAAYRKTWNTGDIDERMRIAETAVNEFPGEMEYLEWLGGCFYIRAFSFEGEEFRAELERSVKCYETVIEEAEQGTVRNGAISGIVMSLRALDREDEGLKYAEMYPDFQGLDKADVMSFCLKGDAWVKNSQEYLNRLVGRLSTEMMSMAPKYRRVLIDFIKLMIPDGNYLYYHTDLCRAYIHVARDLAGSGDLDGAMETLRTSRNHAVEFDRMCDEPGIYRYTSPYLDMVEVDPRNFCRTGTTTELEDFREMVSGSAQFAPLRDRADFLALLD